MKYALEFFGRAIDNVVDVHCERGIYIVNQLCYFKWFYETDVKKWTKIMLISALHQKHLK